MTTQTLSATWVPDASGNWTTGANWSTQVVVEVNGQPEIENEPVEPVGAYNVTIAPSGTTPITVTYNTTDTINSLAAASIVTLDVTGGTLTLAQSAGFSGAVDIQAGTIDAQNGWTISGGLNLSAGATLEIDAGAIAVSTGTLAGNVTGAGNLYIIGGDTITLGTGFTDSTGTLEIGVNSDGFGADLILTGNIAYTGNFLLDNYSGNDAKIYLNGYNATMSGTSALNGEIEGSGTYTAKGAITVSQGGYSQLNIDSGVTFIDAGTLTQYQNVSTAGSIVIDKAAVWNIVQDSNIGNGGVSFTNNGLLEKTAGTNISYVAVNLTQSATGTLDSASGTLRVNGSFTNAGLIEGGNVIVEGAFTNTGAITAASLTLLGGGTVGGNLAGAGQIDFDNGGAYSIAAKTALLATTINVANNADLTLKSAESFAGTFNLINATATIGKFGLTLTGPASLSGTIAGSGKFTTADATVTNFLELTGKTKWLDTGTITQNASVQTGGSSTDSVSISIGRGDTYNITGAYYDGNGNVGVTGTSTITNAGLFEMTGTTGYATIYFSKFTSTGSLLIDSGLSLVGGTGVLGGKISGAGALYLQDSWTLNSRTSVTTAQFENNGAGTLAGNITYANSFLDDGNGNIDLAGNTLSLTGTATLQGSIGDHGTLAVANATIGNFSLYGTATLIDAGKVSQTGSIDLGTGTSDLGTLNVLSTGTWTGQGNQWLGNPNINDTGTAAINNAGLFTDAAGGTLDVWHSNFTNTGTILANGAINLLGGTTNVGGALAGTGSIELDTSWTLAATAALTVASLDNEGAGTLTANALYAGTFTNGGGASMDLAAHSLSLTGPATLQGSIGDHGTLTVANATIGNFSLYGTATLVDAGTVSQTGSIDLGSGGADLGTLSILSTGSWTGEGGQWLGNPNQNDTGLATINNAGLFATATGGTLDVWHANFTNTGTLQSNGELNLLDQSATLAGTLDGTGTITLTEAFTIGAKTTLSVGTFENSGTGTLLASVKDTGLWQNDNGATLTLGANILTLADGGLLGGLITGAGELAITGGTATIASGGTITAGTVALAGTSSLALQENLTLTGAFTATAVAATESISLGNHTLTLHGTSSLTAGKGLVVVDGPGTLQTNTATITRLTLGGGATLQALGPLTQTGAITLGDATGAGTLAITAAATWNTASAIGTLGTGDAITNAGLFEKTTGANSDVISAAFTNTGTIEVTSGSLVFTGGFTNSGTILGTETSSNGTVTITAAAHLLPETHIAGLLAFGL